jgi:hypothetical protein
MDSQKDSTENLDALRQLMLAMEKDNVERPIWYDERFDSLSPQGKIHHVKNA